MPERLHVDLARDDAGREDRLGLGGEGEGAVGARGVEDGLLAHVVAGEEKAPLLRVPEGEAEHAAELLDALLAVLEVERKDDLGVGASLERVALRLVLRAELGVVVDLAVADEDELAGGVRERLAAAGEVVDREAALADGEAGALAHVEVVRAAVGHEVAHGADLVRAALAVESCDAAHGGGFLC